MFRTRTDSSRGQTMVEFALILPILVLLLTGFFDLGRVVLSNDALSHAAREAARYAIVHGGSVANLCPVGPLPDDILPPAASASCPFPSPSKESIRVEARQQAAVAGSAVTVEVCYGQGCVGDTDNLNATNERGTPVTVTVHSTVQMTAGSLIGFSSFDVSSSSTMLVNH
jgi:Flp pilus assembly protein TadG